MSEPKDPTNETNDGQKLSASITGKHPRVRAMTPPLGIQTYPSEAEIALHQQQAMDTQSMILTSIGKIENKLSHSPALNGGFERLMDKIDVINDRQVATANRVDQIHTALYSPDNGFFARVKSVETGAAAMAKELDEHEKEETMFVGEFKEVKKHADTTSKLTKIAGEDLSELSSLVKLRNNINRIFSVLVLGAVGEVGKIIWDIYHSSHR